VRSQFCELILHDLVVELSVGSADGDSNVVVQGVLGLVKAEVGHGHAGDAVLASKESAHGEVEGHLLEVVGELHLLHLCVGIVLVVHILHEVLGGNLIFTASHVNGHEVAGLDHGGGELNAGGLLQKLNACVTALHESLLGVNEVVSVALVLLSPHGLHASCDSDLAGHVVGEGSGLMGVESLGDQLLGSDRPSDLPASAVKHLAGRVNIDGLVPVGLTVVGERGDLSAIERQVEVDLVVEDSNLGPFLEDLGETLDFLGSENAAGWVVGVVQDDELGVLIERLLEVVEVEVPLALLVGVHGGGSAAGTGELNDVDVLSVVGLEHVHEVALAHHVVHDRVDGANSTVGHEDLLQGVDLAAIEVRLPPLGNSVPQLEVASHGRVLVVHVHLDDFDELVKEELRGGEAGNTVAEVLAAVLQSELVELGPDGNEISGLGLGDFVFHNFAIFIYDCLTRSKDIYLFLIRNLFVGGLCYKSKDQYFLCLN